MEPRRSGRVTKPVIGTRLIDQPMLQSPTQVEEIVTAVTPLPNSHFPTKRKGATSSSPSSFIISCVKLKRIQDYDDVSNAKASDTHEPNGTTEDKETICDKAKTMFPHVDLYYNHVAKYWPTELPSFEYILRPHLYYMDALDFNERPNLIFFCESHANSPNVGPAHCEEHMKFGYISLVHCLAYGELHLLSRTGVDLDHLKDSEKKSIRIGTIQFWKLLSVLAGKQDIVDESKPDPLESNDCFAFLMAGADRQDRVEAKKEIFQRLKERRIALVDASLFPIYHGSWKIDCVSKKGNHYYTQMNPLKEQNLVHKHLSTSWESYAKPLITTFKPRNVLILSKGLAKCSKGIEEILSNFNGKYQGERVHPSTNLNKQARLEELMAIRRIASNAVAKSRDS